SFSIQKKKVKVIFILFVLLNKKNSKKIKNASQKLVLTFERHSFLLLFSTIMHGALEYHCYLVELIDIGLHQYCLIQRKLHKLANTYPTFGRKNHPFFQ